VAVIVEALTDNRNRAASNIRSTFSKNGGNLGETGSVSFMWDRVGQIVYAAEAGSEDKVMEAAIEAGADDVESDEDGHIIYTAFEQLSDVAQALEASLGAAKSTSIAWRPKALTPISGDAAGTLMKMLEALEDEDDVQNVYSNADISAEELEKLAS
jgi:YebC/PmpR family DNA-binding regulatory protein